MTTPNKRRLGIEHARKLLQLAIADIESRAQASAFKESVLGVLREAEFHTWRNVEKAPSRRISEPMDRAKVMAIKLLLVSHPNVSNKEIADRCKVQAGRVSEVRQGKYDHLLPTVVTDPIGTPAEHDFRQLPLAARRAA